MTSKDETHWRDWVHSKLLHLLRDFSLGSNLPKCYFLQAYRRLDSPLVRQQVSDIRAEDF